MRIEEQIEVHAPREEVWKPIADPAGWPGFMAGITRFDHEGGPGPDLCVGSRFSMRMRVGSADVGGLIEVVECDPAADLAWTSVTGIDQRGRWRLRETSGGATRVVLRLSYGAPGGLLGLLTDRLSAGEVRQNLRASLENLKARVEGESVSKEQGAGIAGKVMHEVGSLRVLAEARVIRPIRPDKLVRLGSTLARWGRSPAAGFIAGAVTSPHEPAVVDELGTLTFSEVDRRSNALAHSLSDAGIKEGDGVAIMCRNHRGFVESTVAVAKLGAHALYLNTAFAGPQLTEVVQREKPAAIVYDEEFADLLTDAGRRRKRFIGWREESSEGSRGDAESTASGPADPTLEDLIAAGPTDRPVPPEQTGKAIILTSGTTGTPKGANRSSPQSLGPAISLLSKIPLRTRQTTHIAAPLFHSWGFAHFTIGLLLSSTMVLARKFDPENCLAQIERTRAESLVVVPVMMQRILDLPEATRRRYDVSSLRVVAASGSALPGDLATEWMDEFGDNLYNLYGSTEVAWATIATPEDMRAAPGTAGKPPRGTVLKLYDDKGVEVPEGETGRIFVGNELLFEGYTGGGSKDEIDGLMATGDVGRLDYAGRLFVEGRDDEMIVSGGENLFPKEVEDLISRHGDVAEVAAIGVDDEKFGQRLRAFVVPCSGKSPTEDALKDYVKSNLANYKVPREIWFLDELPRNATGKVLKRELKEMEDAPGKS